jgi:hypothetical protein
LIKAYSFARRRWSTPLDGAFVEEGRDRYTPLGGHCSSLALFSLPEPLQVLVRSRLTRLRPAMEASLYNLPDAAANAIGLRIRSYTAQTCVSFCALMLNLQYRPDVVHLRDVLRAAGAKMVFRGSLVGLEELTGRRFWQGDSAVYTQRLSKVEAVTRVFASQARAVGRIGREYALGNQPQAPGRKLPSRSPSPWAAALRWPLTSGAARGLRRLPLVGRRRAGEHQSKGEHHLTDENQPPPAATLRWHWQV